MSVSNPRLAGWFSPGGVVDLTGMHIGERTAMGLSSIYRAVNLVSGTLAMLPMPTYRPTGPGKREQVPSVFDDPDGADGQTPFEWKRTLYAHLMLHGCFMALKHRTAAGGLLRLEGIHPSRVMIQEPTLEEYRTGRLPAGGLWFDVGMPDGSWRRFDQTDIFYVPALALDGLRGRGLLYYAQEGLGATAAADKAAANTFANGAQISGMATPDTDEDIANDVPEIRRQLDNTVHGYENAGKIAVIARQLKFVPWTMTLRDAQMLENRQFQIEEVSRYTGVPPHLLMQTEKQTSWGTGVDEQNRALGRTVLAPWSQNVTDRGSRLLARPRWIEVDFTALEKPAPDKHREMVRSDWDAGLITRDEARDAMSLEPVGGEEGKAFKTAAAPAPAPDTDSENPGGPDDQPAE